jgi:CheY-like chemotaxis protein
VKILIVEDNVDTADSFKMLLELAGHSVRAVYVAGDALPLVDEFVPDVAFVDLGLPDMPGYELARRLRADPRTRAVTLVALTGSGSEEDKDQARDAGFDHYLTKPVDLDVVTALLARVAALNPVDDASTLGD